MRFFLILLLFPLAAWAAPVDFQIGRGCQAPDTIGATLFGNPEIAHKNSYDGKRYGTVYDQIDQTTYGFEYDLTDGGPTSDCFRQYDLGPANTATATPNTPQWGENADGPFALFVDGDAYLHIWQPGSESGFIEVVMDRDQGPLLSRQERFGTFPIRDPERTDFAVCFFEQPAAGGYFTKCICSCNQKPILLSDQTSEGPFPPYLVSYLKAARTNDGRWLFAIPAGDPAYAQARFWEINYTHWPKKYGCNQQEAGVVGGVRAVPGEDITMVDTNTNNDNDDFYLFASQTDDQLDNRKAWVYNLTDASAKVVLDYLGTSELTRPDMAQGNESDGTVLLWHVYDRNGTEPLWKLSGETWATEDFTQATPTVRRLTPTDFAGFSTYEAEVTWNGGAGGDRYFHIWQSKALPNTTIFAPIYLCEIGVDCYGDP